MLLYLIKLVYFIKGCLIYSEQINNLGNISDTQRNIQYCLGIYIVFVLLFHSPYYFSDHTHLVTGSHAPLSRRYKRTLGVRNIGSSFEVV